MGIKLEAILLISILVTSLYVMSVKLEKSDDNPSHRHKDLAFSETLFTEVNTTGLMSISYATRGERTDGILFLENFVYSDNDTELIKADKVYQSGKTIYMDGNVYIKRTEGIIFTTQHAYYDRNKDFLEATAPFNATKPPNEIYGLYMHYDGEKRELYASQIRASFYNETKTDRSEGGKRL